MRNSQLEQRIATERVAGVTVLDIKQEMTKSFSDPDLLGIHAETLSEDFRGSSVFLAMIDIAAFSAQRVIRRANGVD